ncbi:flavin monoamine oxidase family protein [Aestuariivirga litoralis]|uniref:flavin monoamine oxidase family protein n=1 Tax=Aestuariivirga litoralis TaxID=2650924 RepID=UPI0018C788DC|nr:NAD(P)/FAD-dependent oxidoreductase [Aestuariivirga litoralis]MBG1233240.1 FAD-dependent oxidoreductase [Aestuariivirga litoralis]
MKSVVIIGAGMAGAAAALKLGKAGIKCVVLEAQDRIGGRAFSKAYAGAPNDALLEYGGSWITPYHDRIRALVAELGLSLRPRAALTQRFSLREGNVRAAHMLSAEERRAHEKALTRVAADAVLCKKGMAEDELGRPLLGITYAAYMERVAPPPATRHMFDAWWSVSGNGAHDSVAASEFLSSCAYGGGLAENMIDNWSDTVVPGMALLAQLMLEASGADLRLSCPVVGITQDEHKVSVTLVSGELLQAERVILAASINVMNAMTFSPALPSPRALAIAQKHGGCSFKVWIKARGVPLGTLITGDGQGIELLLAERAGPDGSVMLIGFGLQLNDANPGDADWVRGQLQKLAPNAEFISYDWHDWVSDPYARGTWVAMPADLGPAFEPAAWQPFGRLAFASSDYAPDQAGWFEGAVKSGEAAADWVLLQSAK